MAYKTLPDGTRKWYASANRKLKDAKKPSGKLSAFDKALFLAWDGEGAEIEGRHEYILFGSKYGRISNPNGLSTEDCLTHLCATHREVGDTRIIHVMFGMGYDVNMILRDVPKEDIAHLWNGQYIEYKDWHIEYRPRKELIIKKWNPQKKWSKDREGKWHVQYIMSVHVWDVWGFFQSSFVQAIRNWLPTFDRDNLNTIADNKLLRSTFKATMLPTIEHYMLLELDALEQLMKLVRNNLKTAGITISRWDGAGAIAAGLLKREHVKQHMGEHDATVEALAAIAYAGGRIELMQYGQHKNLVHGYDINSAYPSAMVSLPSFAVGTWVRYEHYRQGFGIWHIKYRGDSQAAFHPFFWRGKDCRIYYPPNCEGWYFTPEVEAALAWDANIEIIEGYVWEGNSTLCPFNFIPELYTIRQQMKTAGNDAHKVLKLGLNSLYGKLAQQVGSHGRPPYHNLLWAGWITSTTRARLFDAAMQHPDSIIFLATDGILSSECLDLPISRNLGDWEYKAHHGAVTVQAGVYWLGTSDHQVIEHYRGFDKGSITLTKVIEAWQRGDRYLEATSTRFIGMGTALTGERWQEWRQWKKVVKKLNLDPSGTKRDTHPDFANITQRHNPARYPYRTLPHFVPNTCSHPFPIVWAQQWQAPLIDGIQELIYENEVEDSTL